MSTHEAEIALSYIDTKLRANATLVSTATGGIRHGRPPKGSTPPWVLFKYFAGSDTVTITGTRILTQLLFSVTAVGLDSTATTVYDIAALIDDTLKEGSPEAVTGGRMNGCFREESILYTEDVDDGTQIIHCGGIYRFFLEQS
jgi:hypothetical protein